MRSLCILISVVCGVLTTLPTVNVRWFAPLTAVLAITSVYQTVRITNKDLDSTLIYNPRRHWHLFLAFYLIGAFSGWLAKPSPVNLPVDTRLSLFGTVDHVTERDSFAIIHLKLNGFSQCVERETAKNIIDPENLIKGKNIKVGREDLAQDEASTEIPVYNQGIAIFSAAKPDLKPGMRIKAVCFVKESANPSSEYRYSASVFYPSAISVQQSSTTFKSVCQDIRERIVAKIETMPLDDTAYGLMHSFLLGDRRHMDADKSELMRDGGVVHILAVSGTHIAIIWGIAFYLFTPLIFIRNSRLGAVLRALCALSATWMFVFITGMAFSTVRAALMITFASIGYVTGRRGATLDYLLIAATVIIVFWPRSMFNAGFQLSFCCVGALILFATRLNPVYSRNHRIFRILISALLAALIPSLAAWALTGYYFGKIPIHFLISNLIILPLLPIYIFLQLFGLGCTAMGISANLITSILNFGAEMLFGFLEFFRHGTIAVQVGIPTVALWIAALMAAGAGLHSTTSTPTYRHTVISNQSRTFNTRFLLISAILLAASAMSLII